MMALEPYNTLSSYYKTLFGEKVYKIALNAHLTCPNRDGKIDTRGCLFCSEGGSGEFAGTPSLSIWEQIEQGKRLLQNKTKGNKYIAYFQAFTNTYGDLGYLCKVYTQAINHPDIVGIAIATRPDCLDEPILELLSELNKTKKIWVELGLQTIHEKSAELIRRGYPLKTFDEAVENLHMRNIEIVVHLIIGLPYETKEQILETLDYVVSKPIQGIKLQLLHVLKNTDLAALYEEDGFPILSLTAYVDLIIDCIERTPTNIVFHRITGDGPKNLLIAPQWSADKKNVLNTLQRRLKERT
ncbi:MAG: TIGR01212 family radical SAM protein, partial [Vallitaleaceae bacterium]|nr:TIGR01212 family radical SAM protein [Vallitaleaceae bacterium]